MKVCPKCRWSSHHTATNFCYKDGTAMIENKACECGHGLHPLDEYCTRCGAKVELERV